MIIVSDITPIISLMKAGQLELLQKNSVNNECTKKVFYDKI